MKKINFYDSIDWWYLNYFRVEPNKKNQNFGLNYKTIKLNPNMNSNGNKSKFLKLNLCVFKIKSKTQSSISLPLRKALFSRTGSIKLTNAHIWSLYSHITYVIVFLNSCIVQLQLTFRNSIYNNNNLTVNQLTWGLARYEHFIKLYEDWQISLLSESIK